MVCPHHVWKSRATQAKDWCRKSLTSGFIGLGDAYGDVDTNCAILGGHRRIIFRLEEYSERMAAMHGTVAASKKIWIRLTGLWTENQGSETF
jgi:hypothetical protein